MPGPGAEEEDPLAGNTRYTRVRDLGEGTYGSVGLYRYQASPDAPFAEVAVKKATACAPEAWALVEREVRNHRTLRHPHVIRFKEVGLCSSGTGLYLALE